MKTTKHTLIWAIFTLLLTVTMVPAQKGQGKGKPPKDDPPPTAFDPAIVMQGADNTIQVMNGDGSNRRTLHQAPWVGGFEQRLRPVWSHDGEEIVYHQMLEAEGGGVEGGIFVVDKAGAQPPTLLIRAGTRGVDCAWSPDGRWIAFDEAIADSVKELRFLDTSDWTTVFTATTPLQETNPSWSPDGTRLASTLTSWSGAGVVVSVLMVLRRPEHSSASLSGSNAASSLFRVHRRQYARVQRD